MSALPARRPAETTTAALAVALLAADLFGLDEGVAVRLAVVLGFVPAGITWLVEVRRGR